MMTQRPVFLTLAGSDPSGGAGLQADLRVAQAMGCYGMAVVTALTVQNTTGVKRVWPMSYEQVREQALAVMDDIRPDAVKVGMLGNEDAARAVVEVLQFHDMGNVVVDTVLKSTSGACLFEAQGGDTFRQLLECATIITPNLPEADTILSGHAADMADMARQLSKDYADTSVYLKGGHGEGDTLTDVFYNAQTGRILQLTQPRIDTRNTHGTGCTLSSAVACLLAKGLSQDEAAQKANTFMHRALVNSRHYSIGHGKGPAFVI